MVEGGINWVSLLTDDITPAGFDHRAGELAVDDLALCFVVSIGQDGFVTNLDIELDHHSRGRISHGNGSSVYPRKGKGDFYDYMANDALGPIVFIIAVDVIFPPGVWTLQPAITRLRRMTALPALLFQARIFAAGKGFAGWPSGVVVGRRGHTHQPRAWRYQLDRGGIRSGGQG